MKIELTPKQFRRLLDMAYIGNWILNSARGEDRISDYDELESYLFSHCLINGSQGLVEIINDEAVPSRAFVEGGIHEAIMDYEDTVFFEILAEELARRDMQEHGRDENDDDELNERIKNYIAEFEMHGTDNISLDI